MTKRKAAKYRIEGWRRLECVGVAYRSRPDAVVRLAWHYALDKNADTVWVYEGPFAVYTFDGMFWKKHRGDAAIEAAIEAGEK